jgi:hypothetical protein
MLAPNAAKVFLGNTAGTIGSSSIAKYPRPIDLSTVQLPSKTRRFLVEFRGLSRVRSTESSGFVERAVGIEPTSEVWEAQP